MRRYIGYIMRSCVLVFFLLNGYLHGVALATLPEAQEYAAQYPEYDVSRDSDDWLRPDFSSFHKQNRPTVLRRLASWFGAAYPVWDARKFRTLLKQITTSREQDGFQGDFAERYKPHKDDKILIFGDLFGAFHSLVRDLTFLHDRGVITNSFKIAKPNYVLIFNGNVIDGSPYILETLTIVLRLMEKNPSRVFYVRGYHEEQERWHNFELARELQIRARHISREQIPLNDLLIRFFNTLPIALYLTHEVDDIVEAIFIGSDVGIAKKLDKQTLAHALGEDEKRGFFKFSKKQGESKRNVEIKAFITSEDRSINYHKTNGLTMLGAIGGSPSWLVFSAPTERSQNLYKFHYDAFAQVQAYNGMKDWTIALFNQRVPDLDGFNESEVFSLTTGQMIKKKKGVGKEQKVYFGATMDLSKGASPIGKKVKEGLELAFDKEHAVDTVPGIVPELTTYDDEYTPRQTRNAVDGMMKNGINIFIGSQGSASLESYLDLVRAGKVLVLFPFTGATIFRKPDLKNIIHYRGSYIREGEELIRYAIQDLKSKKIAIFYQDDAFGRGALEGARRELKDAGISNFLEVAHERNVVDYRKQAGKIRDFNPDTILFSTNAIAIRGLIRQMGVQYFAGKKLLGLSVYEDAFERFLKDKGLTFILIRMVPDPKTSDLEIVKQYREWANRKNITYDKVSLEQFINANILFEILRTIEQPVTSEKIIAAAEKMKNYPLKGLVLDFNPETRELSKDLWLDTGHGAWLVKSNRDVHQEPPELVEQPATIDREGADFRVGTLTDFSKGTKRIGKAVRAGIELRLGESDAKSDAKKAGLPPQVVFVDDQYTPSITRQEVEKLLESGINTLLMPTGSPTLEVYIDLVKEGKLLVLFPLTGAPIFRKPELTNIIFLRASYDEEGRALTNYAIEKMRAKKLLLFYQDDSFGQGLLNASLEVLKAHEDVSFKEVAYERNDVNFQSQVKVIKEYDPDTILFFSTATAAQSLIRQLGVANLMGKKLLGCSDLGETKFVNFIRDTNLELVYASVVPNPETSDIEIVKRFREAAKRKNVALNPLSLESYIATDLLLRALNNIQGDVTNTKIIEQLTSIKDENYKGLKLKFDPEERTLIHSIWFDTGKPEWEEVWVD